MTSPTEIEVTPEMIEAGCLALCGTADIYTMATNVYRAMEAARRKNAAANITQSLSREANAIMDQAEPST